MSDAFPGAGYSYIQKNCGDEIRIDVPPSVGLSKRELFAAMAMHGFIGHFWMDTNPVNTGIAQKSIELADALLKALEEK